MQGDESLKNDLIGLLEFSVESVKIDKPDLISPVVTEENDQKLVEELVLKLDTWNKIGREGAQEYEELCIEALRALFIDDLSLWEKQKSSNNTQLRFDLICKIKNGVDKDFWNIAQKHFNTKYIIFEFMNYSKKITQKEIYTTERYLYTKALRNIAIIISPLEPQKNAIAAMYGSLRENGKLVLYITKDDILEMLNAKLDNKDPADFISNKLDDILVKIGK